MGLGVLIVQPVKARLGIRVGGLQSSFPISYSFKNQNRSPFQPEVIFLIAKVVLVREVLVIIVKLPE